MASQARALLIDITRCIGCRGCVSACKAAHGLPGKDGDTELSATALTAMVDLGEDRHIRKLCRKRPVNVAGEDERRRVAGPLEPVDGLADLAD